MYISGTLRKDLLYSCVKSWTDAFYMTMLWGVCVHVCVCKRELDRSVSSIFVCLFFTSLYAFDRSYTVREYFDQRWQEVLSKEIRCSVYTWHHQEVLQVILIPGVILQSWNQSIHDNFWLLLMESLVGIYLWLQKKFPYN